MNTTVVQNLCLTMATTCEHQVTKNIYNNSRRQSQRQQPNYLISRLQSRLYSYIAVRPSYNMFTSEL